MTDFLLDTGVLIRHLRNKQGYPELMERLTDAGEIYIYPPGNYSRDAGKRT